MQNIHSYTSSIIESTCTTKGYKQNVCKYCKKVVREQYKEPLGHDFSQWETIKEATNLEFGSKVRFCVRCNLEESQKLEPKIKFSKIYIDGNVTITNNDREAACSIVFDVDGQRVESFAEISLQNINNSKDTKKDYIIDLYETDRFLDEKKVDFLSWPKSSTFYLNGDMYDHSKSRNLAASKLFSKVRGSDDELNEGILNSLNNGASEGFFTLVYFNGVNQGLFYLQLPKNEILFESEKAKPKAVIYANSFNKFTQFYELPYLRSWTVLYTYDDDKEWIKKSFNDLVTFVMENEGNDFKNGIGKYLDVQATIDYMLSIHVLAAGANTARNVVFVTYDGVKWIPSLYDADLSLGLDSKGNTNELIKTLIPDFEEDDKVDTKTSSLLWQRMFDFYFEELEDRYFELRKETFTTSSILEDYKKLIEQIPEEIYSAEAIKYSKIPSIGIDPVLQVEAFLDTRWELLDKFFAK